MNALDKLKAKRTGDLDDLEISIILADQYLEETCRKTGISYNAEMAIGAAEDLATLIGALEEILEESPSPRLPYGKRIVEIASEALAKIKKKETE
jgi:hypothetical protein